MKKRALLSLIIIGALAFAIGASSYAWFTSNAASAANVFTAGKLQVDLEGSSNVKTAPFSVGGNIQPGDIVTNKPVEIVIKNKGNLNLAEFWKFVVTGESGGYKLSDKLYFYNLEIKFLEPDGTATWADAENIVTNGVISDINEGVYQNWAGDDDKLSLADWNAQNIKDAGLGVGMGALQKDHSYKITFELKFDEDADNHYQELTMNGKFVVKATQISAAALEKLAEDDAADANDKLGLSYVGSNHMSWLNSQIAAQASH